MTKQTVLFIAIIAIFMLNAASVLGEHTPSSELVPEWSPASTAVDYTATICNSEDSDPIDEVRIVKNILYTGFSCDEKTGWVLVHVPVWYDAEIGGFTEMCWYFTLDPADNINEDSCDTFGFTATTPAYEDCNLLWKFHTTDETTEDQGDWETTRARTGVDSTPPVLSKDVEGPYTAGTCPPVANDPNSICWITQEATVYVSVEDPGDAECQGEDVPPSGLDYCDITLYVDDEYSEDWHFEFEPGTTVWEWDVSFDEDSVHDLQIVCYDVAGNMIDDTERFKVDTTPPVTTFHYDGEHYVSEGTNWIDTNSEVSLTAEDEGPICEIGLEDILYKHHYLESPCDWHYCYDACEGWETSSWDDGGWTSYDGPWTGDMYDESCHVIEYYSYDQFDNRELVKTECFFVDKTTPTIYKEVGQPQAGECPPGEADCYVTSETMIDLYCYDDGDHPSGAASLWYRYRYTEDGEQWSAWMPGEQCGGPYGEDGWCDPACEDQCFDITKRISFPEASLHELEFYCEDNVGKMSEVDGEYFNVDNEPPIIYKDLFEGEWIGECPPEPGTDDMCYINDGTVLYVWSEDTPAIHMSNDVWCQWGYYYEGEYYFGAEFPGSEGAFISFYEDSRHDLVIECWDAVENTAWDNETFYVDLLPPVTTKEYGLPFHDVDNYHWITQLTPITLTAVDEKVGVYQINWRYTMLDIDDQACTAVCEYNGEGVWTTVDGDTTEFNIGEDSCHVIEFYSTDLFGHEEIINRQCVFVDTTPPEGVKTVGMPNVPGGEGDEFDYWVTRYTNINLDCTDANPHPVGGETTCFKVELADDGNEDLTMQYCDYYYGAYDEATGYCCVDQAVFDMSFMEDSNHLLSFYCMDQLDNINDVDTEWFKVDTVPPTTTHMYTGEYYVDPATEWEYIDTNSWVELSATDGGEVCHVDGITTYYHYSIVDDSMCEGQCYMDDGARSEGYWTEYTVPFGIPDESCHMIEYYSVDELTNTEEPVKYDCVFVDKSAPVTTKSFTGPQWPEGDQAGVSHWISDATEVHLAVEDPEPHPSGVAEAYYRWQMIDDAYCYDPYMCDEWYWEGDEPAWESYDDYESFWFNIPEESCHIIEYKAEDNVGKEGYGRQCVFVDTTAPLPNKTVGLPNTQIMPEDYDWYFYPDVNGQCWQEEGIDCWGVTLLTPVNLKCVDQDPHPVGIERVCFNVEWDNADLTQEYCVGMNGDYNISGDGYCCLPLETETFYFGETTEHKLSYYCEDVLGNRGELDTEMFKVEETSFEIQINKKWNLISVPVGLLDDSIDEVFAPVADKIISVSTYDAETDSWFVYFPDAPESSNLDTMEPGWGYWVLAKNDTMITIGGSLLKPNQGLPSRGVIRGWNLIGYFGAEGLEGYYEPDLNGNGKPAWCALHSFGDDVWDHEFSALYTYWEPWNPNTWIGLSAEDYMNPGAGYWVWAHQDSEFIPVTNCNDWGIPLDWI